VAVLLFVLTVFKNASVKIVMTLSSVSIINKKTYVKVVMALPSVPIINKKTSVLIAVALPSVPTINKKVSVKSVLALLSASITKINASVKIANIINHHSLKISPLIPSPIIIPYLLMTRFGIKMPSNNNLYISLLSYL
jgi:hypothetical protein